MTEDGRSCDAKPDGLLENVKPLVCFIFVEEEGQAGQQHLRFMSQCRISNSELCHLEMLCLQMVGRASLEATQLLAVDA